MPYEKTIICLADSVKHGGRCFAGKEIGTGKWIRPVSDRPKEEISDQECRRPNGERATKKDKLKISFIEPRPHGHQTENHLIDNSQKWTRKGQTNWGEIKRLIDPHQGSLWINGPYSWGYRNNQVPENALKKITNSLLLIQPSRLEIGIGPKGGSYPDANVRIVKGYFTHNGINYTLAVTDNQIRSRFRRGQDRRQDLSGSIICVSLGEVYKGYAYKLIAAVFEP